MVGVEQIQSLYPLHWLVWNNDFKALEIELAKKMVSVFISKSMIIFV